MVSCECFEQVVVESLGSAGELLDLQARFAVQIVAHVARLEIKIDHTNLALLRFLILFEIGRRFQYERRIADTSGAGNK